MGQQPIDLGRLLADPAAVAEVPAAEVPGVLALVAVEQARLDVLKSVLAARLATAGNGTPKPDGRASEWLTGAEVVAWLGYSDRTIRRYMHDGTWRRGEQWFRHTGSRPRFKRSALEAWLQAQAEPAPVIGLAYGDGIPHGRRRRWTSLHNNRKAIDHGATTGEEADGAAAGIPGARATGSAPRSG